MTERQNFAHTKESAEALKYIVRHKEWTITHAIRKAIIEYAEKLKNDNEKL